MFDDSSPDGLLTVVEQTRSEESALYARRMTAIAGLLWQRTAEAEGLDDEDPSYALITGFARTCAEVAAAMNVAPVPASAMVSRAEALDTRLPQIHALLATGHLDWSDATAIITRTEHVDPDRMAGLDAKLAATIAGWDCWSRRRLLNTVDAAIRKADPQAAKQRRQTADTARRATLTPQSDGMARFVAVLSAPAGALFAKRLAVMAAGVCAGDPRNLEQREVDAMEALGKGRFVLECACEREDCPVVVSEEASGRFVLNVVAGAATVTGHSDDPGYLDGYGVIDADQVRDLADGGALLRPATPPQDIPAPPSQDIPVPPPQDTTEPTQDAAALPQDTAAPNRDEAARASQDTPARSGEQVAELLRHQPSAAAARWVRCRSLTCSFPGCNRSAWRADLDHSVAFDHDNPLRGGWTMTGNLAAKCRQHHRLKTFHSGPDGSASSQLPDGTVVWTSPTGRVYRSTPDGAELFDDIKAASTPRTPRRRNHRREKLRRTALARAGMQVKRTANAETLRINRARAREIDYRKWRNNFRRTHLVLNGTPSTSPWCEWVNDPPEDEHITADWRPPPPKPTSDDDTPPF